MQKLIYILGLFFMGMYVVTGQTQTENYVQSTAYQVQTKDGVHTVDPNTGLATTTPLSTEDFAESIAYYDGLGRPIQSVTAQAGGQRQDVITATVYDGFGRQSKQYLPYARATSSLDIATQILPDSNGNIPAIHSFYLQKFPDDLDPNTPNPYSETIFENSALNRTLEQAAPGADWSNKDNNHLSYDHTIKFGYRTNTLNPEDSFSDQDSDGTYYDNIKQFSVTHPGNILETTELLFEGFYPKGELHKTITKDENFVQQYAENSIELPNGPPITGIAPVRTVNHTTEEYKDKQGRVILKRTYNEGIAHDTQYVYDDFGNLTYVLSPKGSDLVLAQVKYKSSTTTFSFAQIGPQLKGLTGTGGGSVDVNSNSNKITVNFNFSFNGSYHLRQGPIVMIDSNLPNMDIGSINGTGYNYDISIKEGYLHLTGSGLISNLTKLLVLDIPEHYVDDTVLDELCYQYRYDYRNRLIEKKIPQKDWEYIIYDKLDRPVLIQDANLRANNQWLFTKYDAFGRVVYTGQLLNLDDDRAAFQDRVNNQVILHETPSTTVNTSIAGYEMYYTNDALQFPNTAIGYSDLYTINYYDTYNPHLTTVVLDPTTVYGINTTTNTKTLTTGSRIRVLDGTGNHWITSVSYYDDKARPIYAASHNSLLGSTDIIKTELDFIGKVIQTENTHTKNGNTIVVHDAFTYDHTTRLLTQVQTINSEASELIVNNHYDELGQLISKDVGGTVAGEPTQSNGLQSIDYTYNIRGWLKTINDLDALGNDLFGFRLNYNTTELIGGDDIPDDYRLYNGNISETIWKTSNDASVNVTKRGYIYEYDAMNRINKGVFRTEGHSNYNDLTDYLNLKSTSYDKNGNILALNRSGIHSDSHDLIYNMDKLVYDYNNNQLTTVTENGDVNHGFKATVSNYAYDDNGNMTEDSGKGIDNITYNHLNLPTQVTVGNDNIRYIYDATGVKLQKLVTENGNPNITDYAGNYIYKDDNLEFFSHPEGYVEPNGSSFKYIYQYKDHLGNIRLSYNQNDYVSYLNDAFYEEYEGWWFQGGIANGSIEIENQRLKVNAKNAYNGPKFALGETFNVGDQINIRLDLDTGTTDKVRVLAVESDGQGNWSAHELHPNAPTGSYSFDYTIAAMNRLALKIDKRPSTDNGTMTHFYIDNVTAQLGDLEIVEENNYYPFGLKHKGYNNQVSANVNGVASNYKTYQGQEYTEDLDLNIHEWRYRVSDPAIGRFWQIDPLAEDYEWMTTYQFSSNQPIHAPELEGLESMNDLNSRDTNLQGRSKEEMAVFNDAQNKTLAISAAVTVDVFITKGAITRSLLQQTALNTTINGADQFLDGGIENLNFNEALGDAVGNADLFDAGMDALTSKIPGGNKIMGEIIENVSTSMADITYDGGFQMGGVNKDMSDVATDLTFSVATNQAKNINVPNVKFSGTGLGKNIKDSVIDVVSGSGRNNLPSSNTKPDVGKRKTPAISERGMNVKVSDNVRFRRHEPKQ